MEINSAKSTTKVLVFSSDTIGIKMAGPGIRYYEMSRVLNLHFQVTLAAPEGSILPANAPNGLHLITYRHETNQLDFVRSFAELSDIIIIQGNLSYFSSMFKSLGKFVVVDLYDPFSLESLQAAHSYSVSERQQIHFKELQIQNDQLLLGDFFICGSEKQRDYWLGALNALNRVNPLTYDFDAGFRKLIDLVPFGIQPEPPKHTQQVLKGIYPGISSEDKLLLWGGGIWEWFDAVTLIKAMAQIVRLRQDVKLFFMGIKHPNPIVPEMQACRDAVNLATELGLKDRFVFFNDWTPYEERHNYLTEADIGISLHLDHIETRFSLRTRIFDYIWAGLPIISTAGDSMSELITQHNLGKVVEERATEAVVESILELLEVPRLKETFQPAFDNIRTAMSWESVLQPLIAYCHNPNRAADLNNSDSSTNYGYQFLDELGLKSALVRLGEIEKKYNETVEYTEKLADAYNQKSEYAQRLEAELVNQSTPLKKLLSKIPKSFKGTPRIK